MHDDIKHYKACDVCEHSEWSGVVTSMLTTMLLAGTKGGKANICHQTCH